MKYVNAPNFEKFRQVWQAKYLGGFVVHNKAFDGLTGKFPIGFLVWQTNQNTIKKIPITEVSVEVLEKNAQAIGEKTFYNLPNNSFLNVWLSRPKTNKCPVLPLKNGITPATSAPRVSTWADHAIAYMYCGKNDMQHAEQQTVLFSSPYGQGDGFYVTPENLWQAVVIFTVRRLIMPTWLNDRDQFLQPTEPLSDEFKTDCLMWMLFNRCNRTASANHLEWNGKQWSIVNHFIPFTEAEVGSPERFESDFMVQYLANLPALVYPSSVIPASAGIQLGQMPMNGNHNHEYTTSLDSRLRGNFAHTDVRAVRDEFKLNRPDVGWYQIRNALKARNASGDFVPVDFGSFEAAYKTLGDKLRPQVYSLGFLKA